MSTVLAHPVYTIGAWAANVTDDSGTSWVITTEDGWSSAPPIRRANVDMDAADGAWDAPAYYSGRTITLTGTAVAASQRAMNAAKDTLNTVLADGTAGLGTLQVDESHLTRYAFVRRESDIKIADQGPRGFVFALALYAPDPRKYSAAATPTVALPVGAAIGGRAYPRTYPLTYSGGSPVGQLSILNAGNYRTPATLVFTGPVTNPQVRHVQSGATLRFALTLAAGNVLAVDLADRSVILNGTANRRPALTTDSAWWLLAPGQNDLQFSGTAGVGGIPQLAVTYRSAWI